MLSHNCLCCRFQDPRSHRCHHAQVGFQVCVRPGSYKVGPQTLNQSESLDPRFSNSEIEWITKEQGGTLLYGLLIRVEWKDKWRTFGRRKYHNLLSMVLRNWQPNSSPALSKRLLESSWSHCGLLTSINWFLLSQFWLFALGLFNRPRLWRFQRTDTACTLCFGHSWANFNFSSTQHVCSIAAVLYFVS